MGEEGGEDDLAGMKAALASKGYEVVDAEGSGSDSDGGLPGRIQSLEPGLAREKGNKAFQQGKYDKAIKCWQGGLKNILSSLCAGPHAMSDTNLSELDLTLNLNIAMAYMKKGDFVAADRSVEKALARREALPPHQVTKALYRKASAQRSMHRLEECLETLKDLLEVEAGHAAARQMQQEVEREWNRQCREQKKNLRKLFSKLGDEDKELQQRRQADRKEARRRCGVRWTQNDVDSEAFELGEAPACDGSDWGLALNRSVLWAMEQFAVEGNGFFTSEKRHLSIWFVGVSSTCELRWLQARTLMERMPGVESLELALIGFLGELDPEGKRVPDPKAESVPQGVTQTQFDGRRVSLRVIKGTLQDALAKELAPPQQPASESQAAEPPVAEPQAVEPPAAEPRAAQPPVAGPTAAGAPVVEPAQPEAPEPPGEPEAADLPTPTQTEESAPTDAAANPPAEVPPSVCFIAHPQLHRYFTDFFPAISWLVRERVPTVVIGASEPDHSWAQDEVLLKALGANVVVSKRLSPYPMSLPDNPTIKKCNHIIGFLGGKAVERDKLTKVKLELLAQDYTVR